MKKKRIPLAKVKEAFSKAIKRRDMRCMIKDFTPCEGGLECSHYHTQGANPCLMFYPPNAHTQCSLHHFRHHHNLENGDFYDEWMKENEKVELSYMMYAKHGYIKYTNELKEQIIKLCNADKLDDLAELIREEIQCKNIKRC